MKSSAFYFNSGDLLYGRMRPYLNKVYQPNFKGLCSAEFIILPKSKVIFNEYLKYLINSSDFVEFANNQSSGDRPRVNFNKIKKYTIPLPPLHEQQRIVNKIEELFSELDAGVESLKTAQAQLKRYRQSVLKSAFEGKLTAEWREQQQEEGNLESAKELLQKIQEERQNRYQKELDAWEKEVQLWEENGKLGKKPKKPQKPKELSPLTEAELAELPELPKGWIWQKLGCITGVSGGITKNSKRNKLKLKLPYLRVANVYQNRLLLEEISEIGVEQKELDRILLKKDDLLFVEGNGSIDQIGRVAIWDDSISPCIHQNHLIKARPYENINIKYVLYFFLSYQGRNFIKKQAGSTSGLYTLSLSKVKNLKIPLIATSEQNQIVEEIESRFSICDQLEATITENLQKSEALRQSILKQAFSGKLVPQDPNDEPASVLLDRIKQEKENTQNLTQTSLNV